MLNIFLNILPILATVLIVVSYLPQIKLTYQSKNVEGQSLSFWTILISALGINVIREIFLFSQYGTYGGLLTQGLNLLLAVVILVGILKYRKQKH